MNNKSQNTDADREELAAKLQDIGLSRGDTLVVFCNLANIKKHTGIIVNKQVSAFLLAAVGDVIGKEGSIVVPTFNWDFTKGKDYNHEKTESQMGYFSNYVLFTQDSIRSFHPVYSFACLGPLAEQICANVSRSSFGPGSVFERLHKLDAKMLFIDVDFSGCAYIQYIEQAAGINYRRLKYLVGNVTRDGKTWHDEFSFFVRQTAMNVIPEYSNLEKTMKREAELPEASFGESRIMLAGCKEVFDTASRHITHYPYFLLKHPPSPPPELNLREIEGKHFVFPKIFEFEELEGRNIIRKQRIEDTDYFFQRAFSMLKHNRVHGDYLEFGGGGLISTIRLAYKYKKLIGLETRLFSFDSFQGLPEIETEDSHPSWYAGDMAVSESQFRKVLELQGIPLDEVQTIAGFFEDSIKDRSPQEFGIEKAAAIFIDCDLYTSARIALEFALKAVEDGAVLAFDDWFCYNGDPRRGEQKAFTEVCEIRDDLIFTEHLTFNWGGKSFIVNHK